MAAAQADICAAADRDLRRVGAAPSFYVTFVGFSRTQNIRSNIAFAGEYLRPQVAEIAKAITPIGAAVRRGAVDPSGPHSGTRGDRLRRLCRKRAPATLSKCRVSLGSPTTRRRFDPSSSKRVRAFMGQNPAAREKAVESLLPSPH